ncbi:HpcH/HpaI aldolase/citrate lyase family protein [Pyruvatibacter mobilis]|uniref:HpcH/HpaI aldolase/citrate lyase family protein n=1 Tax=Pyruvatibacter mobilis TaxID=1712261 RepID=UPI003C7CD1CE
MRSLLFVPADSEKKRAKALEGDADALILDLEDSVAPSEKPRARAETVAFLRDGDRKGKTIVVRVNPVDGPHCRDDVTQIVPAAPDMIMLPKATPEGVQDLSDMIAPLEREAGLEPGSIRILTVATETPGALFVMDGYVHCEERLAGLSWGAEDLAAEMGATSNRRTDGVYTDTFRLARTLTLAAARHAGVLAIDSVYTDFRNEDGLRAELAEAVRDGFDAKLAIHPAQVAVINQALTPSAAELAEAQAIVDAFAASPDQGVLSLNGRMIDRPHLLQAQRVLMRLAQG